jgi:uncharacterized protein YjbJ (UPF0337 family)
MEGETDDVETPQPPTGAWPAEVWLAGEKPKEEGQAEQGRGKVAEKIQDVKEKLDPKIEDVKETLGPHLENAKDKLGPKLQKAQGKFGQAVGNLRDKLFRKK